MVFRFGFGFGFLTEDRWGAPPELTSTFPHVGMISVINHSIHSGSTSGAAVPGSPPASSVSAMASWPAVVDATTALAPLCMICPRQWGMGTDQSC